VGKGTGLNWLRILENGFRNSGIQPWALLPDFVFRTRIKIKWLILPRDLVTIDGFLD
jgi:hypothetical protein